MGEHAVSYSVPQRREVHYSGRVQGVGFRYTAQRIARKYQVVGFVRNLPDGRVHLVAEGAKEEISRFLEDLSETMDRFIHRMTESQLAPTGEFEAFEVRY